MCTSTEQQRQAYLKKILPFFPGAFIYKKDELIIEKKNNVYFRIDNVNSNLELDCKILEYLSRPSCKGLSDYWQRYFRRGVNSWFKINWTKAEMMEIYTYLGNGVNRKKCIDFIKSDFDLKILKK